MSDDAEREEAGEAGDGADGPHGGSAVDMQGLARGINELLVLSTLRNGSRHGYQIALDVEGASGGVFQFQHGTLYPILHRLEDEGLIRGAWSRGAGRKRKVYSLTEAGRRHLEGGTGHLSSVMETLMGLLRGPDPHPA
jgi:PadR family transcriptional regulator, regulatory protein PadR